MLAFTGEEEKQDESCVRRVVLRTRFELCTSRIQAEGLPLRPPVGPILCNVLGRQIKAQTGLKKIVQPSNALKIYFCGRND
jgi:hypothetical protein